MQKKTVHILALFAATSGVPGFAKTSSPSSKPTTLDLAKRLYTPGSFEIFTVPAENNMIVDADLYFTGWSSHFRKDGGISVLTHSGTDHNTINEYDTHIPLIFWGKNYFRSGSSDKHVSMTQVIPTLAKLAHVRSLPDVSSKPLDDVLKPDGKNAPRAVLMLVIDQGGWSTLERHKSQTPNLQRFMKEGFNYTETFTDYGGAGTAASHAVLGTGTFPTLNGIFDNSPYVKALGKRQEVYTAAEGVDMLQLKVPTLADLWGKAFPKSAPILSYSIASRAAVGMAGHGASYEAGQKSETFWYDSGKGRFATDDRIFSLPEAAKDVTVDHAELLAKNEEIWKEQTCIGRNGKLFTKCVLASPRFSQLEGETLKKAIRAKEATLKDSETHALFLISFKGIDYCGHYLGQESIECEETMAEIDRQIASLVQTVEEITAGDLAVVITADHGAAPLTLFSGGKQLHEENFKDVLNETFGNKKEGLLPIRAILNSVIQVNIGELRAAGHKLDEVARFVKGYKLDGKAFFKDVIIRSKFESGHVSDE